MIARDQNKWYRFFMKIDKRTILLVVAAGLLPLFGSGCGSEPEYDWYDASQEYQHQKDQYIEDQVEFGLTPEKARESWDRKQWKENTIRMADGLDVPPEPVAPIDGGR